eukprot:m.131062 g.131062  ORF g.131062 m.131062 type:complete len:68 (-) comp9475_c0_seq3:352-555(-)
MSTALFTKSFPKTDLGGMVVDVVVILRTNNINPSPVTAIIIFCNCTTTDCRPFWLIVVLHLELCSRP